MKTGIPAHCIRRERCGEVKDRWIGNKKSGIELRYCDEGPPGDEVIDEVILWINDKVVMHMEAMSEVCYWFGFYLDNHGVSMNISSKNLKSHIQAIAEER